MQLFDIIKKLFGFKTVSTKQVKKEPPVTQEKPKRKVSFSEDQESAAIPFNRSKPLTTNVKLPLIYQLQVVELD